MQVNPHIFRAYDIRGIADPEDKNQTPDLTEETVYLIAKATATYLQNKYHAKTIAVGTDCRLTAEPLKKAYIKGLTEMGMEVSDIGLCTSPMLYWTVCALKFDAGTAITASHNPKEYNGLKIVSKNAHSICGDELQEVLKIIQNESYLQNPEAGSSKEIKVWSEYLKDLTSKVKPGRKLKVVVDSGNGAAGPFAPELLEALGCEVISLYCEPDGNFPNHEANPEELKNMLQLIDAVKEHQADFGMGFDGDGDRIGIVNEKGELYSADYLILMLARDLITRQPGAKVVFDVKVSQVIIDELEKMGATPIMCKTGHSFIERKMKEIDAPLAGEVSGHLFFNENYFGFDDAFLAAAKIVEIISNSDKKVSEHFSDLPKVYNTPEIKVPCPDDQKFGVVKSLVEHFTKLYPSTTIDGVRVNFTKSSWGAVRASNTSPNLTLRFEADSPEQLEKIKAEMYEAMKKEGVTI
jgi:phosphomannomutase/phosphoglucomutase